MSAGFWKYFKNYKGLIALALILAAINQIFSLLDPQIIRLITDNYATKTSELSFDVFVRGVLLLLLAFIGVSLVSRIAKNLQDYYVSAITQNVGTDMYAHGVEHTFSLPYSVFEDQRSGETLLKLQKARQDTQLLITSLINVVFLSMIGILFVVIYAFYVHWSIGAAYILLMPITASFIYFISNRIKKAQLEIVKESADLAGSTTETLRNVELVKSLGLENQEITRLNNVNKKILGLELKKIKYIRTLSFIQGTMINAMRAGIMFLMLYLLFKGYITLGEFFTLFIYSFFIFSPLGEFATVVSQYQEAKASNQRLDELLDIKPQPKPENPKQVEKIKAIEFKGLSFAYQSNKEKSALDKINIKIKKGETIAFVGLSGSGKTTLVKLILGLYNPIKGKLLFNGIDSKEIDYESLRKQIGLVSQETQLFAGTIRENLLFVNPQATDEQCMEVLKQAQIDHILIKGLDTRIGEQGIKLSGGERQRLAIARALLRNPDIIVFDEATSSLDSLTEKEITKTIKSISKQKPNLITILVAHRLSTIAHSDKIIVLEKGKILENGTHSSLLKKKGLYSALWRQQSSEGNEE